jgi:hypothetical protein
MLAADAGTAANEAAETAQAALDVVLEAVASTNLIGYIDAWCVSYGAYNELADPNAACVTLKIEVLPAQPGHQDVKLWVWFSAEVEEPPTPMATESLGGDASWGADPLVGWELVPQFLAGNVLYEPVYVLTVRSPPSPRRFYRVVGNQRKSEVGGLFPIRNGASVNGRPGKTITLEIGGVRLEYVGGFFMGAEEVEP